MRRRVKICMNEGGGERKYAHYGGEGKERGSE